MLLQGIGPNAIVRLRKYLMLLQILPTSQDKPEVEIKIFQALMQD